MEITLISGLLRIIGFSSFSYVGTEVNVATTYCHEKRRRKGEQIAKEFNDSLERCLRHGEFLETFYERFTKTDEEIAALFAHTDMGHQQQLMKAALFLCATARDDRGPEATSLREMGRRHRDYGIRLIHYEVWLSTLTEVVSEYDPFFSVKTVAAWESMMRRGVELMKEGHFQDEKEAGAAEAKRR